MSTRACTKCGSTTNGFHKNPMYSDGLHPHCKVCRKQISAARKARETPEQREARLIKQAEYRNKPENKERQTLSRKDWMRRNPERVRASGRAADQRRAVEKARYAKQWREKNREVVAAYSRNRRAVIKNCEGSHTVEDIKWLMQAQRYKCAVCSCNIKSNYHVDHIEPLAKGGSNAKENLQVLCPTCNNQKHAADPIDFMQRKGFLL